MNIQQSAPRQLHTRLNQVKKTLRRRFAEEFQETLPVAVIRRAVDEAEQLAHSTGFPHLVFPLLAEETVHRVSRYMSPETASEPLLATAAA